MTDGRWQFNFTACNCPDARFLWKLGRTKGPWAKQPWGDSRSTTGPVEGDEKDAAEWKEAFAAIVERPLIAFALAIDFNQEPAQRAMEKNRWKLVALGERGHDRVMADTHVFSRLYMKKFPKSGKLFSGEDKGLQSSYSCSLDVRNYFVGSHYPNLGSSYAPGTLILHRIVVGELPAFNFPEKNFVCIAKTPIAHYFLSNAVEIFVRAK